MTWTNDEKIETLNHYKSELRQLPWLRKQERKLLERYVELEHASVAPNSPRYDGMPHSQANPLAVTKWTLLDEQKESVRRKYWSIKGRIQESVSILTAIEPQSRAIIKRIYVSQSATLETVAIENGLTVKQVRRNIDNDLLQALRKLKKI